MDSIFKARKQFKGEKYIYLLMGYQLAKNSKGLYASIGNDSGMIGGQNYWRAFSIHTYQGRELLTEHKTTKHFAEFTRTYEVLSSNPKHFRIVEFIDNGDNMSSTWIH